MEQAETEGSTRSSFLSFHAQVSQKQIGVFINENLAVRSTKLSLTEKSVQPTWTLLWTPSKDCNASPTTHVQLQDIAWRFGSTTPTALLMLAWRCLPITWVLYKRQCSTLHVNAFRRFFESIGSSLVACYEGVIFKILPNLRLNSNPWICTNT